MGNKEVRDILLGRIVRQDAQFWTVAPADVKFRFHGIKDGAGDVRLFGVTHKVRRCRTSSPETDFEAAEEALHSMGRPMRLHSVPEGSACLYAPNWIAPVLLTVEKETDGLQITAYTGRSLLFGRIRCRIALWMLRRRLPESILWDEKGEKPEKKEKDRQVPEQKPVKQQEPKQKSVKKQASAPKTGKRIADTKKKKNAPKRLKK